ncbi:hypothetical protein FHR90_003263 [Endobacter medicaginis]|uniref:Phage tail protein n=1 Tax=Endobacter medicaginis TaxID=1181271 RepID=A0A850NQD3_9PROT|nr:phage tail protein [Endobacter medicaginis]MBB3175408.1 hypothetical protein [Endobacter medicaginis]MCX5476887.1 phage tail protein [Endobacter medicaginis]NVN29572.1 phage tail protein [Endobacter medicaginis]
MPILQSGSFNITGLQRPGVYVDVVAPSAAVLSGANTSVLGLVGVGSWGPLNKPVLAGSLSDAVAALGPVTVRMHDLSTHVAVSALQGASNFRLVRVSDGTDTAASFTLSQADDAADSNLLPVAAAAVNGNSRLISVNAVSGTLTALYTGIVGNSISVRVGPGSRKGTWKLVVALSGGIPETYDNLTATGTPTTATYQLTGGTDGGVPSTAALLGTDISPRTGLYALRGSGVAVVSIADCTDSSIWTALSSFALSEGAYAVATTVQGDTIANAVSAKSTAGLDSWAVKLMLGDWLYWLDATNSVTRLVSPAAVAAGELVSLSPEQSSLNKALVGIIGSQHAGLSSAGTLASYADADIGALESAGIDVISNPSPGGAYWSAQTGHNTSSDSTRSNDAYSSMTNYLARTINGGAGVYVGKTITVSLLRSMKSSLDTLLGQMVAAGMLDNLYGTPYSVVCDTSNNPQATTALGLSQAQVYVRYSGINEKFLVNLQGGATVSIGSADTSISGTSM